MERSHTPALDLAASLWGDLARDDRGAPLSRDPRREERLRDLLRSEAMGAHHRQAQTAAPGSAGERVRGLWRGVLWAWRARATSEIDAELASLRARTRPAGAGFEMGVITASDPVLRAEQWQSWDAVARRELPLRVDRAQERASAARGIGVADVEELSTPAHPVAPRSLLADYERSAIAPLDDRIAAATAERARRAPLRALRPEIDAARDRALAAHLATCPSTRLKATVRDAGRILGSDADTAGWGLEPDVAGNQVWPRLEVTADRRPRVRLGSLTGLAALLRGVAVAGRAARWRFHLAERGAESALFDPAFDTAAGALWARQVLSPEYLALLKVTLPEQALSDARLELALAPRCAWAYLEMALATSMEASGSTDSRRLSRVWLRAAGREPTPDEMLQSVDDDLRAADALRGWVLALLIEERQLTRHGRRWFAETAAIRWLRDAWFAEAHTTAEDVAEGLGLGRMEPTPLVERCRP